MKMNTKRGFNLNKLQRRSIVMNQSKLIILRGNSGSGKTTTAKALQQKLGRNTLLLSQDVIRRDMLWVKDGEGTPAISLLVDLIKYGRTHCETVILEGILDAWVYRSLYEVCIQEFGSHIYAYYYDIPFEETLRRHQTKPNMHEFGENEMRGWWKEKDYIGLIEERIIAQQMEQEETVEMIYNDINVGFSYEV